MINRQIGWKTYMFIKSAVLSALLLASSVQAAQTGDLVGQVSDQGAGVSGISISASSTILPGGRSTTTDANGNYRLPLLPPGVYELTFTLSDGAVRKRTTLVSLGQRSTVDVALGGADGSIEELVVYGSALVDTTKAALSDSMSSELLDRVPVGQEYRDIMKLIPGVQYSEDSTRGPSAGGSGQDNVYQFDGVDVSLPLFGTLSAEPSSHDIDQVSVVRGGAKAIGFNRSGGFLINTKSKSGTDEFHADISYQLQTAGLTSAQNDNVADVFDEDKAWIVASASGPIIPERLFFYASYYGPTIDQKNRTNAYGSVPGFKSDRDEFFGKLTFAPTDSMLLEGSYRTSNRKDQNDSIDDFEAATLGEGAKNGLDILILEGSWIINSAANASFKYTNFQLDSSGLPDNLFDFPIAIGDNLNIAALDQQGRLAVPTIRAGEDAYNAFIAPIIAQFGFGDPNGGGAVGGASTINDTNYERDSIEVALDYLFDTSAVTHDIHFGLKWSEISEDLSRTSNGWGSITVPGGRTTTGDGTPIFYEARFEQMSLLNASGNLVPGIVSSSKELSFEINDSISINDFTIDIGVLLSNDKLFGSGLSKTGGGVSGFEVSPGTKYKMREDKFGDLIQPRVGVTWDFRDDASMYVNWARYNPAASSLARAASWDRNLRRSIRARFDANGNFIEVDPVRSSSGKLFQDGIDPRQINEFLLGGSFEVNPNWVARAHIRYRKGSNFWEDTNNDARVRFEPPAGIPRELYIPNLQDIRDEIGGSSYVIAELDDAFTKYWEVSFESEWNWENIYLQASYTWSKYTGNFDQDNTTTTNDGNIFIGSSLLADGQGRQLWDNKKGTLRGDRRHQFKAYGFYQLPWNASAGAYVSLQSGQPWEAWDVEVYRDLLNATGSGSTSDTNRYAESAGSRRTKSHLQVDLNYTQNFAFGERYNLQLRADLYNVFDSQTGYNINAKVNSAGFEDPRDYFNPRRLQLMAKVSF